MDQQLFLQACRRVRESRRSTGGIGTLSERNLHAVLKYYLEPYEGSHEVPIGSFVADIVGEDGIVEIQTRGFDRLRDKLTAFLSVARVTVVYPIPHIKWLSWLDPATGEVVSRRRSPKRGVPGDACRELYKIKPFLDHPQLRLRLLLVDLEELRYLDGWSVDKKRGSTRAERLPTGLAGEIELDSPADYLQLLPSGLPEPFTTRDVARVGKLRLHVCQTMLNLLLHLEVVRRVGKQGRLYLYQIAGTDESGAMGGIV